MNELIKLQEEIEQIESLIKVVSDTDSLDTPDVEDFYRNEDRIINGSHIDKAWKALALKGKVGELLQKSYTLGIMKGVELVEGELPKYPPNSDREELVLEQIKSIINKLKQELK